MKLHNLRFPLAVSAAAFLLGSLAVPAQAQPSLAWLYTFVKLDYPGAPVSYPLGINMSRQIVGVHVDAAHIYHGYFYQNGVFTSIDYPGAAQFPGGGTITGGINDHGMIAGTFADAQGFQHGFVRTVPEGCAVVSQDARCKPSWQQIDVPGAAQTRGIYFEDGPGLGTAMAGINNQEELAGMYATQALYSNAVKVSHGNYIPIDDPASTHAPGEGSRSFALNDFGVVAGAYLHQASPTTPPVNGGFVYDGRNFIPVMVPGSEKGGFGTQANGINNLQEVTGVFSDPEGVFHGLLWLGGQSFTVDYPNAPYTECHAINSRGDITGAYIIDPTGPNYRGFVAYPKLPSSPVR